jgi:hypothetical protein
MSASSPAFAGVVRSGRLHADDKAALERHLTTLEGQRVTITVDDVRSTEAHRYLFGPVYDPIAAYTGDTKQALHEFFKRRFLTRSIVRVVNHQTGEILEEDLVESSKLQTVRGFYEFTEQVKLLAAEFMGLTIPEADPSMRAPRRRRTA